MKKYSIFLALLFAATLMAQPLTTPVSVAPDCLIFFDFTAAPGNSANFDNRFVGCDTWNISYTSTGFTVLSLVFQSAPDAGGTPGAWVNFAGTIVAGINPNTAVTQASTVFTGYYPWTRARLAAVTGAGRVRGLFYGYRTQPVIYTSLGGTINVNLAQVGGTATVTGGLAGSQGVGGLAADGAALAGNPVLIGGSDGTLAQTIMTGTDGVLSIGGATSGADSMSNSLSMARLPTTGTGALFGVAPSRFNGATWDRFLVCTNRAVITLAGSGNTEIVAAAGGQRIRVCHVSMAFDSAVDMRLTEGTGVNCATGTANVTGTYQDILTAALDFDSPLIGTAGQALCVNLGAVVNGGGVITYAQY